MRYCRRFLAGIPHPRAGHPCVTHPSATPSPSEEKKGVRLACVRHAASVCPEPGSNSPFNLYKTLPIKKRSIMLLSSRSRPRVVALLTWLVRRCTRSRHASLSTRERPKLSIDRNWTLRSVCAIVASCCSAFHSSVVKVPFWRRPVGLRCYQYTPPNQIRYFTHLIIVAVVSHISGALSRGFLTNFSCSQKLLFPCFTVAKLPSSPYMTQKRPYKTILVLLYSGEALSQRSHIIVAQAM